MAARDPTAYWVRQLDATHNRTLRTRKYSMCCVLVNGAIVTGPALLDYETGMQLVRLSNDMDSADNSWLEPQCDRSPTDKT